MKNNIRYEILAQKIKNYVEIEAMIQEELKTLKKRSIAHWKIGLFNNLSEDEKERYLEKLFSNDIYLKEVYGNTITDFIKYRVGNMILDE
jgi:hypothetical protein